MVNNPGGMLAASAIETDIAADDLPARLAHKVREQMGEGRPDLALLFVSAHFEDQVDRLALATGEMLGARTMIGTTAEGVICNDREYENQPGATVWAARMPGAQARSFHFFQSDVQGMDSLEDFREHVGAPADQSPYFLLLADPFSVDVLALLSLFEKAYPGRPVFGGMASAGERPKQNRVIFDAHSLEEGAVGVALWGNVQVDTIVSQGCRPIARHLVVTKAERNVIHELGGMKAAVVLKQILDQVPPGDRALIEKAGMFIGRAVSEPKDQFSRGDFLIRNLLGLDKSSGAIAINDLVRPGQTVQFHVRDATSATEDIRLLLGSRVQAPATGALLFTCNGRGTRMFSQRHHDASWVSSVHGPLPVGGFFCAGEIGPVGGRSFVHGHTASIAFFRSPQQLQDG